MSRVTHGYFWLYPYLYPPGGYGFARGSAFLYPWYTRTRTRGG